MSTKKRYAGKNLTIIREDRPQFIAEQRQDIQETACELLGDGQTLQQVADYIGIGRTTLMYLRRRYPAFKNELELATLEGSTALLEQIRDIPFSEANPHRARVKIEGLCKYLELRWPERFGKRLDVTVKTLDMNDALAQARVRAGLVIESTAYTVEEGERTDLGSETDTTTVSKGSVEDLF